MCTIQWEYPVQNQGGIEICAAIHTKIIQFSGSLPENQGGLASLLLLCLAL